MSSELYHKIIDEMAEHPGITLVPFFRGESFLHPHFFEFLKYARQKGVGPIQLTSNATALTESNALKLLELGIDFVSFSLDSNDDETYREVRGFELGKVRDNVERFLRLREAMNLDRPVVQVSAVETAAARRHIEDFISYWRNRVERVRIYTEHSQGGVYGRLDTGNPSLPRRLPCKKPVTEMVIYWDGQVALCNHDWSRKEFLGNVSRQSIQEVWRGAPYREVRARHREGRCDEDPSCSGCDHWKVSYLPEGRVGRVIEGKTTVSS